MDKSIKSEAQCCFSSSELTMTKNEIINILGTTTFAVIDPLTAQCLPSCILLMYIGVDSCLESIFLSQLMNKSLLLLTKVSSTQLRLDTVTDYSFVEPPRLSVHSLAFPFFHSFIYLFLHSLSESPSHAISMPLWGCWPSSFPLWNSFHTHSDFSRMWMKLLRGVVFCYLSVITLTMIWQSRHMHVHAWMHTHIQCMQT